jgi:membrane-associated phospholipid phosphatase
MQQIKEKKSPFFTASILVFLAGLILIGCSLIMGKIPFFLLLNTDLGTAADHFFRFWTYTGDGAIWVPVALLVLLFRKNKWILLVSAIIISTVLTQITKNFIFPGEPRPTAAITDSNLIHTVAGVELHKVNSFPSGHTATAFCIFLIAALLIKNNHVVPVGFALALLTGYSRIYLAQHFPLDVGAGMMVALISVFLSVLIQQKWGRQS